MTDDMHTCSYHCDRPECIREFGDAWTAIMEALERAHRKFQDFTDCPRGDALRAAQAEAQEILERQSTQGEAPIDKRSAGVYHKYNVTRTDGSDQPGGKHDGCEYFVLDLTHDPFAKPAAAAYAGACEVEYPTLASDMRRRYSLTRPERARVPDVQEKYNELILAVGNKYRDETRHETALRYIKQAEQQSSIPCAAAPSAPEGDGGGE